MDLILHNGSIYSMENENAIYEAIAIKNGLIIKIGTNSDILKLKTNNTELINLNGKQVFPGFNDSHMHLLGYGQSLMSVDLSFANSVEEVISITKKFIITNSIKEDTWVLGRGWNQDKFKTPILPNKDILDKISTNHYIFLRRACGHVACSNSKVLTDFHISSELTFINGGEYENGIFKEEAISVVADNIPTPTKEEIKAMIKKGANSLLSFGITSVQSDDLCVFPEDDSQNIFDSFIELREKNELPIRVYEQSLFRNNNNLEIFINKGYSQNSGNLYFKFGPLKILGDGSLGARTAWMKEPYNDDKSTSGISMYTQEELDNFIILAQKNNISSAIHCIGDQMLDSALKSIARANSKFPNSNLRHGIVHCQITSTEQLVEMKAMNVMAYVQPIFLDYDIHIVKDRVGEQLASTSYNWKTMIDLDLRISFGSDAPVETPDPIKGIHCAVKRKDLKRFPEEGYLPNQGISVYKAIYNYTVESAYCSYEEKIKGKLLPNYLADLVILSGNIFENILSASVNKTILNGKVVYKK